MSLAVLSRAACASMSTTTTTTTRDRGDRYGPIEWAQSAAICNEVIYKSTSQFKMCCCTNVQNICHFFNLQMTNIFAPALSFIASRPSCPVSCDFHATKNETTLLTLLHTLQTRNTYALYLVTACHVDTEPN